MFEHILKELGIPQLSQEIFKILLEKGPSSARHLAEALRVPRPSVYDNVKILITNGLIAERDEQNKKVFLIEDIRKIPELLQSKIDSLQSNKKEFEKMLPSLETQGSFIEPKIKFYSGIEGLKQVANVMMLQRNIETVLFWPVGEMTKIFGKEFFIELNKKRIKRRISIRGIWTSKDGDLKKYPYLGVGGGHLREVRLAPKGMDWHMAYWAYQDTVIFISSHREAFGFVVHSKDFAQLIKTQFEAIWKISKPLKPQPKYTDKFLEELG